MSKEIYRRILSTEKFQTFEFVSTGKKGSILKRIEFIPTEEPEVYSLIFGDVDKDGEVNYQTISDNGDRNKILATVVEVIDTYCKKFPGRWIYFYGSTNARTRLYRIAIGLHLEELSIRFDIYAEINNGERYCRFDGKMEVTAFLIKRKIL